MALRQNYVPNLVPQGSKHLSAPIAFSGRIFLLCQNSHNKSRHGYLLKALVAKFAEHSISIDILESKSDFLALL